MSTNLITGMERTAAIVARQRTLGYEAFNRACLKAGDEILEEALRIVPKEFWDLAATGVVEVEVGWFETHIVIAFGGVSPRSGKVVDYAVVVHEDLTVRHAPGTSAKYLEKAVRRKKGRIQGLLKSELRAWWV